MPDQVNHWIGGQQQPPATAQYFEDRNPVDDSVYARAAVGSDADILQAVSAADAAFQQHRNSQPQHREHWLLQMADLLDRNRTELLDILIDEIGSPIVKAETELATVVRFLRAAAAIPRQIHGQTLATDVAGRMSFSLRRALGVVAAITPFNVPLIKIIKQTATALATGNSVVVLPSEESPVIASRIGQLYKEAGVPDGLLNVVTGSGADIGDTLTTHPQVKIVSFTGSTRVGRHIGTLCAQYGKRVTLEMGGRNALLVLEDADMQQAVRGAILGSFLYQGQICMSSSRLVVQRCRLDEFLKGFLAATSGLGMGDLRDRTTMIGPIINKRQRERIQEHLQDAVAQGAEVLTGGKWVGNCLLPTVLTNIVPSMLISQQETFGPVTCIHVVDSLDQAIAQANATSFGLGAAAYTSRLTTAMRLIEELEVGMVHINGSTIQEEPHVPFGGIKDSGFGREGIQAAIDEMTEWKWATIQPL